MQSVVIRCVWFRWPGYFLYDCLDHVRAGMAGALWEVTAHHVAVRVGFLSSLRCTFCPALLCFPDARLEHVRVFAGNSCYFDLCLSYQFLVT